jgi:hypothetical protein
VIEGLFALKERVMVRQKATSLLRNQSGHAWHTEIRIIILMIGIGLALFLPKIHSGLWSAVGSTALDLFLFFLGFIVLILVISFLGYLKDRFLDWLSGPLPTKKTSPNPPRLPLKRRNLPLFSRPSMLE